MQHETEWCELNVTELEAVCGGSGPPYNDWFPDWRTNWELYKYYCQHPIMT
jgi:hypothetical protein